MEMLVRPMEVLTLLTLEALLMEVEATMLEEAEHEVIVSTN